MNVGIIIQARLGSERLPKKVLDKIGSKEMLLFLFERLAGIDNLHKIILATSDTKEDDLLEDFAKKIGLTCYRGSLDDVLKRFYDCADHFKLDVIIRVTADDPFKDPVIIEKGLNIYKNGNFDYVSNTIKPSYPEGIDIEIFSFDALKKANELANLESDRMHVTPYIWQNPHKFRLHNFYDKEDNSDVRITCDYKEDLDFLNKIYSYTKNDDFSYLDIIEIINKNKIFNKRNTIRNEGYLKDLKKD